MMGKVSTSVQLPLTLSISIRLTDYEKVAYFKKLISWLFVLVNTWFLPLSIGKLLLTPSIQIFVLFLKTWQEATLLRNVLLQSIHFTCQPSVKSLSWMGFLLLLCFNYFPFLHIQQKMEKYERGGYITSTSNVVCKTHLQDFKTKMQT